MMVICTEAVINRDILVIGKGLCEREGGNRKRVERGRGGVVKVKRRRAISITNLSIDKY